MDADAFPPRTVLARPVAQVPRPGSLPGGARYELKYDGFRSVIIRDETPTVWSRNGTDMTMAFPELAAAAAEQLPEGVTVDAEIVAWADGRLDFDVLLRRLNSGRRAAALAHERPASLVVFDIMRVAGRDIRHHSFDVRRALLEELAVGFAPPLSLSPMTIDVEEAERWMLDFTEAGVEGLVIKGGAQAYRPGERDWLKVKHRDTLDVVVAAVTGSIEQPRELILGSVANAELRIVGRTAPLRAPVARSVGALLRPPAGRHPWPEVVSSGTIDRFNGRRGDVSLVLVEPIVAEVSADVARTGESFRHAVRFLRLRPDLEVPDILSGTSDDIGPSSPK